MKNLVALAFLAGGLSIATAGMKSGSPVWVNLSYNYAGGSLGMARNGPDTVQYIGCSVFANPGSRFGVCYAVDAAGTYRSCMTTDAFMLAAIDALPSDGSLQFGWNATSNNCNFVGADNYSYNEPKR
ncbi:MAG: hypothetical protein M4D80_20610 [Myxococcota bacterium]|nr:hypothetical protein [Deltaproteobacteria bacterium]MDQ3337571.1 hypothetical protein [Myxococcota bacterium]